MEPPGSPKDRMDGGVPLWGYIVTPTATGSSMKGLARGVAVGELCEGMGKGLEKG